MNLLYFLIFCLRTSYSIGFDYEIPIEQMIMDTITGGNYSKFISPLGLKTPGPGPL